jgi:YcxB-like protein
MVVEFEVNLEDLKALQRISLRTTNFHKRNRILNGFFGAILAFILSFSFGFGTIVSLLASILYFIFGSILYNVGLIYQTERLARKNDSLTVGDCKLYISEVGFRAEFKRTTQHSTWSEVKKVYEDEKRYFIYLSDLQAVIIKKEPKNTSKDELINFNKLISGYIKEKEV